MIDHFFRIFYVNYIETEIVPFSLFLVVLVVFSILSSSISL